MSGCWIVASWALDPKYAFPVDPAHRKWLHFDGVPDLGNIDFIVSTIHRILVTILGLLNESPFVVDYSLRDAGRDDEHLMWTLHECCYRDVVVAQFGEWDVEVQRGFFDRKWTPSKYQIIVVDGTDVGAIAVVEKDDHVLLSEILIDRNHQNRGLGSTIVRDIVDRAASDNRPVRLQVLRANRARELYTRLGFEEIGRTDTYIRMEA